MTYFDKAGIENTQNTLDIAFKEAKKRSIKHIIAASTFGDTGVKLAEICENSGIVPVIVTHNAGFKEFGKFELRPEFEKKIKDLGGIVLTGTMVLRNLSSAVKSKFKYSETEIVNAVLRMFGQGMKVCVEMVAMVSDTGLLKDQSDVIVIAGTGRGADTAVIMRPESSNKFFDIKIREILAKPGDF